MASLQKIQLSGSGSNILKISTINIIIFYTNVCYILHECPKTFHQFQHPYIQLVYQVVQHGKANPSSRYAYP